MHAPVEKAKSIKLLICDVDGVLTNGYLFYGSNGESLKAFHVHDGFGLKLLMSTGIEVAIITFANNLIVSERMQSLGIQHVFLGQENKRLAYDNLLKKLNVAEHEIAMIGDDLPDLPLIQRSGLGIAVANAVPSIREHADWVTQHPGGHGAVREVCEMIMEAQQTKAQVLAQYHHEH